MKQMAWLGRQLRAALNQQLGYISAQQITDAVKQASGQTFEHYYGHPAQYRPGLPLPARAYQVTEAVSAALNPFLKSLVYKKRVNGAVPAGTRPLEEDGTMLLPADWLHPTSFVVPGARRGVKVLNDDQVAAHEGNSVTKSSAKMPAAEVIGGGYKLLGGAGEVRVKYLAPPPEPKYAEKPAAPGSLDMVYDDANSVDPGWQFPYLNEVLTRSITILAAQVRDGAAQNASQQQTASGA